MSRRYGWRWLALATFSLATVAASAGSAQAGDLIYWSNPGGNTISFANADGSGGGGDVSLTGATTTGFFWGSAIDLSTGKIYWANSEKNKISYANLNGSGGGDLSTGSADVGEPTGVAVDSATGTLYWANTFGNKISYLKLDGSATGNLETSGAVVNKPVGVAVDIFNGRIYWADSGSNEIAYANLNDTGGGGMVETGLAEHNKPEGVAVDELGGKIYWANREADKISYAALNGTESGNLNTGSATIEEPVGVALEPEAGKIYWANYKGQPLHKKVSWAKLDGSEGGDLNIAGATETGAFAFPSILDAPVAGGSEPVVPIPPTLGSTLTCSNGGWATDLYGSFLYRFPQFFEYQWLLNGAPIPGATGATTVASTPGVYRCRVTASNRAGAVTRLTSEYTITAPMIEPLPLSLASGSSTHLTAAIATLKGLNETNKVFAPATGSTPVIGVTSKRRKAQMRHPRGTTFSFTLDQAATAIVTIKSVVQGRRVGHACKPVTKKLLRKPKCTLTAAEGTLTRSAHAGANRLPFTGRIGSRALKPGRYKAVFTARDTAGSSRAQAIGFTVVAR